MKEKQAFEKWEMTMLLPANVFLFMLCIIFLIYTCYPPPPTIQKIKIKKSNLRLMLTKIILSFGPLMGDRKILKLK